MRTIADAKALGILGYSVTCRRCSHVSSLAFTGLQDAMTWDGLAASRFRCTHCGNRNAGEFIVLPRLGRDVLNRSFLNAVDRDGFMIWGLMEWRKSK